MKEYKVTVQEMAEPTPAAPPRPTRLIHVETPAHPWETSINEELKMVLNEASFNVATSVEDDSEIAKYRKRRGFDGPAARSSHAGITIILPPHPVRISPPERFIVPPNVSLIMPPGGAIEVDTLNGSQQSEDLFLLQGDIAGIKARGREVLNVTVKCPELQMNAFRFVGNQTNTRITDNHIYGFNKAVVFDDWHTDTSICRNHIENCAGAVVGMGGQNCRINTNSFLTCSYPIKLVNAQELQIISNTFTQKNDSDVLRRLGSITTAMVMQGKFIVVTGNMIQDHLRILRGNLYGGVMRDNFICYSDDRWKKLQPGWLAELSDWDPLIGGTNWSTHAEISPNYQITNERFHVNTPDPTQISSVGHPAILTQNTILS